MKFKCYDFKEVDRLDLSIPLSLKRLSQLKATPVSYLIVELAAGTESCYIKSSNNGKVLSSEVDDLDLLFELPSSYSQSLSSFQVGRRRAVGVPSRAASKGWTVEDISSSSSDDDMVKTKAHSGKMIRGGGARRY
eukprot:106651_1